MSATVDELRVQVVLDTSGVAQDAQKAASSIQNAFNNTKAPVKLDNAQTQQQIQNLGKNIGDTVSKSLRGVNTASITGAVANIASGVKEAMSPLEQLTRGIIGDDAYEAIQVLDDYATAADVAKQEVKKLEAEYAKLISEAKSEEYIWDLAGEEYMYREVFDRMIDKYEELKKTAAGYRDENFITDTKINKGLKENKELIQQITDSYVQATEQREKATYEEGTMLEMIITKLARRIGVHESMMKSIVRMMRSGDIQGIKNVVSGITGELKNTALMVGKIAGGLIKIYGGFGIIGVAVWAIVKNIKSFIKAAKEIWSVCKQIPSALKDIAEKGLSTIKSMLGDISLSYNNALKAANEWAKTNNSKLHASLTTLTSDVAALSSGLVAMASPILNALAPVFDALTDKVLTLMNAIGQLFALLTGQDTYQKAVKGVKEYGDAASSAADAQDSLTTGIDELNILSANSGSGSSSSSDTTGYEFIEEVINGTVKGKINSILSELTDFFNDLPSMGLKAGNWLKGLFEDIDPQLLGTAIGTAISGAFGYLAGLAEPFAKDINKVKEWVANTIASAISAIKAEDIVNAVNNWVKVAQGILDGIKKGLKDGDFTGLIKELATGIDWGKIVELITTWQSLKTTIFNYVYEGVIEGFGGGLAALDKGTENSGETQHSYSWANNDTKDSYGFGNVDGELTEIEKRTDKHYQEELKKAKEHAAALKTVEQENQEERSQMWTEYWQKVQNIFTGAWNSISTWFHDTFIVDWTFGDDEIKKDTTSTTTDATQAWNDFVDSLKAIKTWFTDEFLPWWTGWHEKVHKAVDDIVSKIQLKWMTFKANFIAFAAEIKEKVSNSFTSLGVNIKSALNSVLVHFNNWGRSLVQVINNVIDAWNEFTDMGSDGWGKDGPLANYSGNGLSINHVTWTDIPYLANGGIVNSGSLFVANENGPELVGKYGNQSAVMNNDQIVSAVAQGVYNAVKSAMGNGQNVNVYLDGKQLESSVRSTYQQRGAVIADGGLYNYSFA